MNIIIDNYVGIYENFVSNEYCDEMIKYFNKAQDAGFTQSRLDGENANADVKDDDQLFTQVILDKQLIPVDLTKEFISRFWKNAYSEYAKKFSVLQNSATHQIYHTKMQKTVPGGGYHVWHYESSSREHSNRLLTYILYLNDVDEGGETEFLYYGKRIAPKAGTLIIFPAGFTHTHRGNPPLAGDKYIMTGWVEF